MSSNPDTPMPFTPPVVDSLSVRVVVDSHYERFLPKATHRAVGIEHAGDTPGRQMTTLAGEWGLSLHLESEYRGARTQYLLDFGYTPEIINRNFELLGIDPGNMYKAIRTVGPEHCTLSSDAGEPLFPNSVESLRLLRGHMTAFGCTAEEIYTMCTVNPAFIVGLDLSKSQRASAA